MIVTKYTPESAKEYIRRIAKTYISDRLLSLYCSNIYFGDSPASTKHHHVFKGGLVCHTAEVLEYCFNLVGPGMCYSTIMSAAILHDYQKVLDYKVDTTSPTDFSRTRHGNMIYHIAHGYHQFMVDMKDHPDKELIFNIGHCILSHHGRKEWGSPVEPQTPEAMILHTADMMSVKFGPTSAQRAS